MVTCPICRRDVPELADGSALDKEMALLARENTPGWSPEMGLCPECLQRFVTALAFLRSEHHFLASTRGILPTAVRLGAVGRRRGKGVTIAFLDAGFYAHPDLVKPQDRIIKYVDITNPKARRED